MNTESVDAYLRDGCGRCEHYQTPQCKVHLWTDALVLLRALVLEEGLVENMKWGSPCYTLDGANVLMITSFREYCSISFFQGVLLEDEAGLLSAPGPNSQAFRLLKVTSAAEVREKHDLIRAYVREAIELQKSGRKVEFAKSPGEVPDELQAVLDADPVAAEAYAALTPGRQRSYILHVSSAKQESTRVSRAEKCVPKILSGKGFNER
ncbi:MAG: YdeI/OmpD-associated family protein [Alphaproteobacteria bacterium]|nr:YdeI/OmpD-associated family protein [Alphaproteobacteria bacterium]